MRYVYQKNLVRQNFTLADLGENKVQVLAERYSNVFGIETEYVPGFVETADRLKELLTPACFWKDRPNSYSQERVEEMVILIGACYNNEQYQKKLGCLIFLTINEQNCRNTQHLSFQQMYMVLGKDNIHKI